eukprot:Clim_evm43s7 gene=Clim_evmTU43s7
MSGIYTSSFLDFLNGGVSPFHVVDQAAAILEKAGFQYLNERESWDVQPGKLYYTTRNETTIFAFAVGAKYQEGNGFNIVGAHTDSPNLRVKPTSKITKAGFNMVGVETYGGGLWHTWFDRDLTLAGRVIIERDGVLEGKRLWVKRPIVRVPNLAIHLNREVNTKGFEFNKENQLVSVLSTKVKDQLNEPASENNGKDSGNDDDTPKARHHTTLTKLIREELDLKENDVLMDMELSLADTQPAVVGGINNEFVFSPRLDNLGCSYCSLQGLIDSLGNLSEEENIRMVCLFDHEEVGSSSAQGAGSQLLEHTLRRMCKPEKFSEAIAKSFLVSADMVHGVHPNYEEKHENNHKPQFHKGPTIKFNSNQRYATNDLSASLLRTVAKMANVPIQDVMVRNDSPCGSTIGPILASKLGIRTVDLGIPQLSMHSIREMCGVDDVDHLVNLTNSFFREFTAVDKSKKV